MTCSPMEISGESIAINLGEEISTPYIENDIILTIKTSVTLRAYLTTDVTSIAR